MYKVILVAFSFLIISCKSTKVDESVVVLSKAEKIIQQSIAAHGGKKYDSAHYAFTFRKNAYTVHNDNDNYEYSVTKIKNGSKIEDVMHNDGMTRHIDGNPIPLTKDEQYKYAQGVNSVIYFATLPHKLKDQSVNKKYIGEKTIKNKEYDIVQITFDEEGGGKDHDDQYHYWINKETHLIDYLAYNYTVNKGGVRFRSAYNVRNIDGIIFQDYINYKAPVGTPLIDLPDLYEANQLTQLSLIETENIIKL